MRVDRSAAALLGASILAVASAGAVIAQTPPAPPAATATDRPGRFAMSPADGGFMRMDTETGAMALCRKNGEQWACEPVGGTEVAGLSKSERDELARLRSENAEMKATIRSLEELVLGPDSGDKQASKPSGPGLQLPSEQDVDKALDYVERMFKKFRDRLKQLEGGDAPTPL